MGKRILDHLPSSWIEAVVCVKVVRVLPKIAAGIETQRIGAGILAGQLKFLKRLGFWVELRHFSAAKFAGVNHAVRPNFHPARGSARSRRAPLRYLHRFSVDFSDFAGA